MQESETINGLYWFRTSWVYIIIHNHMGIRDIHSSTGGSARAFLQRGQTLPCRGGRLVASVGIVLLGRVRRNWLDRSRLGNKDCDEDHCDEDRRYHLEIDL